MWFIKGNTRSLDYSSCLKVPVSTSLAWGGPFPVGLQQAWSVFAGLCWLRSFLPSWLDYPGSTNLIYQHLKTSKHQES